MTRFFRDIITVLACSLGVIYSYILFVAFWTSRPISEVTFRPTKSVLVNASLLIWADSPTPCKSAIIGSSQALNNINPTYAGLDKSSPGVFGAWGLPPSDALSIFQNHIGPVEHPIIPIGLPTGTMDSRIKMNPEHFAKENVAIPINSISAIQRKQGLEQNLLAYAKLKFDPTGHIPLCRVSDGFQVSANRMTKSFDIDTTRLTDQVSLCRLLNSNSVFVLLPWLDHDSSYSELNDWMDARIADSHFIDARNTKINHEEWLDKCHLDSAGAIKIAKYIRPQLTAILNPTDALQQP
jgi:hypothetical protein